MTSRKVREGTIGADARALGACEPTALGRFLVDRDAIL